MAKVEDYYNNEKFTENFQIENFKLKFYFVLMKF